MPNKTSTLKLPHAETLPNLWRFLGFELRKGFDPRQDYEVPQGEYRRFAAGLSAFRNRGFAEYELRLDRDRLHFRSRGGHWSPRRVSVDTTVTFDSQTALLTCSGTQFTVHSRDDSRYRTIYIGSATFTAPQSLLDRLVAARLNEMLGIIGARLADSTAELSLNEWKEYSDIHPYPRKAWAVDTGRLVLIDDSSWRVPYGRAWLNSQGDTSVLEARFRRAGWQSLSAK